VRGLFRKALKTLGIDNPADVVSPWSGRQNILRQRFRGERFEARSGGDKRTATTSDYFKITSEREVTVSRNPFRSNRRQHTSPQFADQGNPTDDAIIDQAHALYGGEAATAVAYCALDAWFEVEEVEFRRFARLFRRLRN
jgi:hypothetical protein